MYRFHYNHPNVDMAASNYDKRTALHVACAEGHLVTDFESRDKMISFTNHFHLL